MMFARVGLIHPRPHRVFIHFVARCFFLPAVCTVSRRTLLSVQLAGHLFFLETQVPFHRLNRGGKRSSPMASIKTETVLPPPPPNPPLPHRPPSGPTFTARPSSLSSSSSSPLFHLHLLVGFLAAIPIHRSLRPRRGGGRH